MEFSYDLRGNLIEEENITDDAVRHNEWSVTGQLLRVSDEDVSGTAVIQQHMYDDDGTRIQKTEGDSTKKYYYVGNDMAVTTEDTGTIFTGIYDGGKIIGAYLGNVPEYDLYCTDMQGSTSALIDDSLDISGGYRYSEYGEVTSFEDTPSNNEVCYTGAVYDSTTGEHYLRARYYDPKTAVFKAQDTLKGGVMDESLWNAYAYCNGDPVNKVDPTGHSVLPIVKWKELKAYWPQNSLQSYVPYGVGWDILGAGTGMILNTKVVRFKASYKKGGKKRKWRIQLWKGSYGYLPGSIFGRIVYGGECGIYYKSKKSPIGYLPANCGKYKFKISVALYNKKGKKLLSHKVKGWWCNIFKVGSYMPWDLKMKTKIKFHSKAMCKAATKAFKAKLGRKKVKRKGKSLAIDKW